MEDSDLFKELGKALVEELEKQGDLTVSKEKALEFLEKIVPTREELKKIEKARRLAKKYLLSIADRTTDGEPVVYHQRRSKKYRNPLILSAGLPDAYPGYQRMRESGIIELPVNVMYTSVEDGKIKVWAYNTDKVIKVKDNELISFPTRSEIYRSILSFKNGKGIIVQATVR